MHSGKKMQMSCIPFPPSCPSSYPLHGEVSAKLGPRGSGGETWGGCASWLQSDWSEKFRTQREGEQRRQESFAERESNDDRRVSRDKKRKRKGPEKFCKKREKRRQKSLACEIEKEQQVQKCFVRKREREKE